MLNVKGQDWAVGILQRALASGRLGSTWMFAGAMGVGKFLLAREFAKVILCDRVVRRKNGGGAGSVKGLEAGFELMLACGDCESCRAVGVGANGGGGGHPDLHIVTKELIRFHDRTGKSKGTTLSIDVIRGEITGDPEKGTEAKMAKRSFRGRGKVFIIDEADLMETGAQNALLKTLEEPPAGSYLILITASPMELLATIRSRSQVVEFGELPEWVMAEGLIGAGLSAEDARLMGRLAHGSLGRALRWAGDMRIIEEKNAKAAERTSKAGAAAAKKGGGGGENDEEDEPKFTPGGILAWARNLSGQLDELAAGRCGASDVAALMSQYAGEFAELHLFHDKLASEAQAKRDGIALMMSIAAEWFADRLRDQVGASLQDRLPAQSGGIDGHRAAKLITTARTAEAQIQMNVNDKILLAATTTQWEHQLRSSGNP